MRGLWTLRKAWISAFLAIHIACTIIWVLPESPIRAATAEVAGYYMLPLGLWQYWGMFSPDPIRATVVLEAQVVDARNLRHVYEFPKVEGRSAWGAFVYARHPKFAANLGLAEMATTRAATVRYAVRQLDLPPSAFPLDAYLVHKATPAPPFGESVPAAMVEQVDLVIETAHFASATELNR